VQDGLRHSMPRFGLAMLGDDAETPDTIITERAIRAIRAREDVGDPSVVHRDRIPAGLEGGRLSEECRGLREQTVVVRGRRRARSVNEHSHLGQPRAIGVERERVGRDASREGRPDEEREEERAPQDCGSASAASWRSKASLRTRRS